MIRKTPPLAAAATVYYPMTDDEGGELAAAGIGYELVLALDVPVLHVIEEVDTYVLALLAFHKQAIVQIIPGVPVPSSVDRAAQPTDVEQVLNVPVLQIIDEDYMLIRFLEQVTIQETPEVQVPVDPVEQRLVEQIVDIPVPLSMEQVIVQSIPEVQIPVDRVQQRHVAQIVDFPRIVGSSSTGSATAWLDGPQGQLHGFSHFSPAQKKCEGRFAVDCGAGAALELIHASASGRLLHGRRWLRVDALG